MKPDAWAVVVARSGATAKTRLAGTLTVEERSMLAGAMLTDVLRATSRASLAGTVAVLDAAGAIRGPAVVADPGGGLDLAVGAGVRAAVDRGARSVVVLPGDVPLIAVEDVDALLAALGTAPRGVIVATDRHGSGTNALALRPPTVIAPAFGPGSARRHLDAGRAAGARVLRVRWERTALDIDTPADLAELRLRAPGGATGAALGHLRLR